MAASTMKYEHEVLPEWRAAPQLSNVADEVPARAGPEDAFYEMKPSCFRTDKRFLCSEHCCWARSCKKLVAAWCR